ncbi:MULTISPECIES: hypothetical protein [unclassified Variovorax]|uniref:hypothetical protein n=1 Tax=unclassified Variovorax TaxID=663243 RepID=UPI0013164107|nr:MULTISPECIES: hypothetical protein [unclassified Variovorax]VTU42661.1 hypothetical protein H6P1_00247 [Variovorax sp. PBL-H6]VTU43769.1 hypothetical protein SRS16P1_00656 [Variovorax sp. SRS16]VTU43837.1 hypothetical protein E5P1_00650 [Variovorax sp. PBL-E5]
MTFNRISVATALCVAASVCLAQSPSLAGAPSSGARQIWLDPASVPGGAHAIPANAETDAIEARINATFERLGKAKTQGDIDSMAAVKQKLKADFEELKAKRLLIQAAQGGKDPGAPLRGLPLGSRAGSAGQAPGR